MTAATITRCPEWCAGRHFGDAPDHRYYHEGEIARRDAAFIELLITQDPGRAPAYGLVLGSCDDDAIKLDSPAAARQLAAMLLDAADRLEAESSSAQ